jgi:amino acid transporter
VPVTRDRSGGSDTLKRVFLGRALSSSKAEHQLLPKVLALPVFSSDPLSSNAYATQEMMLVLSTAGAAAFALKIPIAIAIAGLLLIVVTSYRQTVRAYPRGGGSYIVARENLGTFPGLLAAAAILIDYILTVAVSITAGTIAIASVAPDTLLPWAVPMATGLVALVAIANLRGVREAGTVFAVPTYGFVAMVAITLTVGFIQCLGGCRVAATADLEVEAVSTLSLFLILRAFSSGATALTGVEAIADGVQAFRRPQAKNAAATLLIMGVMSTAMFLGITVMAQLLQVRVDEHIAAEQPVLAQIGETVFGDGFLFIVLQVFTAGILILAANTAFQDFPRLASILARDRFMPSQFRNRGDRLVFSNGVLVLALVAALLIWAFDADLTRLIQLYVVGVFTAFTLSQTGMVRRWLRLREPGWQRAAIINGVGAVTTGVVLMIVTITKFTHGAWIVIVAMPIIVTLFWSVHVHYERVAKILRAGRFRGTDRPRNGFVLLVKTLDEPTLDAIAYLRAVRPTRLVPLYMGPPEDFDRVREAWLASAPRLGELVMRDDVESHPVRAVKRLVRSVRHSPEEFVTVVIPERVIGGLFSQFLRQRTALALKTSLLFEPGVVVTDVPLLPEEDAGSRGPRPVEPTRNVVLVPVSAVNDASVRAVLYARSLNPSAIEALFMVLDPEDAQGVVDEWHDRRMDVPLVMVEAPFRDISEPLLREIRRHAERRDTVVTVVLPELVPRHWWEQLLHGQTGLFIKRLLLFEPSVVLTSVPFHLRHPEAAEAEGSSPAPSSP